MIIFSWFYCYFSDYINFVHVFNNSEYPTIKSLIYSCNRYFLNMYSFPDFMLGTDPRDNYDFCLFLPELYQVSVQHIIGPK